jgi:hypothetical protein
MSLLAAAILVAMERAVPPGRSAFSVEPVPAAECAPAAASCPNARRSHFYGGWVRQESAETGRHRYSAKAHALALELADSKRPIEEAGLVLGIEVNESGLREDVQMGRGRSGHTKPTDRQFDDAGGQGRGPANEACGMQILPSMATPYGGPTALLGWSPEALRNCYRAALDQLRHARAMCAPKMRTRLLPTGAREDVGPLFATVSMYGVGNSCTSSNAGKTERRVNTVRWVTAVIEHEMRKAPRS